MNLDKLHNMESDYFPISQQEEEELNRLKITYKWRDSCMRQLLDFRNCQVDNYWTSMYACRGLKKAWLECQIERERNIIAKENIQPVSESRRFNPSN